MMSTSICLPLSKNANSFLLTLHKLNQKGLLFFVPDESIVY